MLGALATRGTGVLGEVSIVHRALINRRQLAVTNAAHRLVLTEHMRFLGRLGVVAA